MVNEKDRRQTSDLWPSDVCSRSHTHTHTSGGTARPFEIMLWSLEQAWEQHFPLHPNTSNSPTAWDKCAPHCYHETHVMLWKFYFSNAKANNYIHVTPQVPKGTETGKGSLVGNHSRDFCARNGSCMSLFGFGEKYHLEVSTHSRMPTWSFSTVTVQGISSGTPSPTMATSRERSQQGDSE